MDNGQQSGGTYIIGDNDGTCQTLVMLLNRPLSYHKEVPWLRRDDKEVMIVNYKRNGFKVTTPYKVEHSNGRLYRVYFERTQEDIKEYINTPHMPWYMAGRLYILPGGKQTYLREVSHG